MAAKGMSIHCLLATVCCVKLLTKAGCCWIVMLQYVSELYNYQFSCQVFLEAQLYRKRIDDCSGCLEFTTVVV
jgi:hypothetical protein